MEQKEYYYDKGMMYEFDRVACQKAIDHYMKEHHKTISGFDDDVYYYFDEKVSHRQISEIRNYCKNGKWSGNGERKAKDGTLINYYKKFGKFFGNEMLFLKPVYSPMGTISDKLKYFYGQFSDILYHLSETNHYNNVPATDEYARPFYIHKLKEIRKEADLIFLENDEIYKKLLRLVCEVEQTITQFDIPGVATRWIEVNPRLNYFDAVYEIMNQNYQSYLKIKDHPKNIHFRIHPTKQQLEKRNAYFEAHKQMSHMNLFEQEVCQAFRTIYNDDFKEYLQETNQD